MTDVVTRQDAVLEDVVVQGDLSKLTPAQRTAYYMQVCKSLGLNPLTKPFAYIVLNQRLVLYATRDCTDQLRKVHGINLTIVGREKIDDLYVVTARATDRGGRQDESTGVIAVGALKGDLLANAYMKCETKAKRRVTLSLVGLGWLDETEVETIPDAKVVDVTPAGEIIGRRPSLAQRAADMIEEASSGSAFDAPEVEEQLPKHWSYYPLNRKVFWALTSRYGLTRDEAHRVVGVPHLAEYPGTVEQAMAQVEDYAKANGLADSA